MHDLEIYVRTKCQSRMKRLQINVNEIKETSMFADDCRSGVLACLFLNDLLDIAAAWVLSVFKEYN